MSERGDQLHATADRQIAELLELIATLDEETSRRHCPGRNKLGDGTVAASSRHTAENYGRIAAFLTTNQGTSASHYPTQRGGHRMPRVLRPRRHGPANQTSRRPAGEHDSPYSADNTDLAAVARELSNTRRAIGQIAELTDRELDAVPPEGIFRFCDGRRTLEHVLASLLNHQAHQLDALKAAVG
jgi:hypothetical protein